MSEKVKMKVGLSGWEFPEFDVCEDEEKNEG